MLIFRQTDDFIHFSDDINTFTSSANVLLSASRLSTVCELEIFLPKDAGYLVKLISKFMRTAKC